MAITYAKLADKLSKKLGKLEKVLKSSTEPTEIESAKRSIERIKQALALLKASQQNHPEAQSPEEQGMEQQGMPQQGMEQGMAQGMMPPQGMQQQMPQPGMQQPMGDQMGQQQMPMAYGERGGRLPMYQSTGNNVNWGQTLAAGASGTLAGSPLGLPGMIGGFLVGAGTNLYGQKKGFEADEQTTAIETEQDTAAQTDINQVAALNEFVQPGFSTGAPSIDYGGSWQGMETPMFNQAQNSPMAYSKKGGSLPAYQGSNTFVGMGGGPASLPSGQTGNIDTYGNFTPQGGTNWKGIGNAAGFGLAATGSVIAANNSVNTPKEQEAALKEAREYQPLTIGWGKNYRNQSLGQPRGGQQASVPNRNTPFYREGGNLPKYQASNGPVEERSPYDSEIDLDLEAQGKMPGYYWNNALQEWLPDPTYQEPDEDEEEKTSEALEPSERDRQSNPLLEALGLAPTVGNFYMGAQDRDYYPGFTNPYLGQMQRDLGDMRGLLGDAETELMKDRFYNPRSQLVAANRRKDAAMQNARDASGGSARFALQNTARDRQGKETDEILTNAQNINAQWNDPAVKARGLMGLAGAYGQVGEMGYGMGRDLMAEEARKWDIDAKTDATSRAFTGAGLSQLGQWAQFQQKEGNQYDLDRERSRLLTSMYPNYGYTQGGWKYDPQTGESLS